MIRNLVIVTLLAGSISGIVSKETSASWVEPSAASQATAPRQDARSDRSTDGYLAKWMTVTHVNQVELARVAVQRATDPEVKRFAQKLIEDHEQFNNKLSRFVTGAGPTAARPTDKSNPPVDKPNQPEQAQPHVLVQAAGQLDHSAFFEELGQQCLSTARSELESKQGAEFDRCYVAMVVGSHLMHNDMALVFHRHASAELKDVLNEAQTSAKAHLSVAREFAQRLERKALAARKSELPAKDAK